MATVHVDWVNGMTFIATDSTNHSVVISTTDAGVGMKPSELLLAALAGCTAVDVVSILQKKRAKITDLRITVNADQPHTEGYPRPFANFRLHYAVTGVNLKAEDVKRAIELSEEKYCMVAATLRQENTVSVDFEIIDAGLCEEATE